MLTSLSHTVEIGILKLHNETIPLKFLFATLKHGTQNMPHLQKVNCSIARALGEVGERWSMLIIREALMGSIRFDEFHERLGVARNILNSRLSTLVGHGVMTRTPSPDNARIFHYCLTPKGLELLPVLASLMQWGDRWIHNEIGAPIMLVDRKSQMPVRELEVSGQNGKPLRFADIAITAGPGATPAMRKRLASKNLTSVHRSFS
jgi:DNA-binding HxlR family transcriptional regulator